MRPQSIVNFERFYLASVLVWLVNVATGWNRSLQVLEANPQFAANPEMLAMMPTFIGGTTAFALALSLLLWFLAARKRSGAAKWILVIFFALASLSVPFMFMGYEQAGLLATGLSALAYLLHLAAIVMLFQRGSNEWFGADGDGGTGDGPVVPPSING